MTFLFLADAANTNKIAVFIADIDLAVGHQRRTPHVRLHVVRPVKLAGLGVQAMHEAGEIADEQQPGGRINRNRGEAAMDFVVTTRFWRSW